MVSLLIVESDFRERPFLHFVLNEAGFSVQEPAGGSEAFDNLMRGTEAIDLVMLEDEHLETLSALRLANPDVRCCVLTNDYPEGSLDSNSFIRHVRQVAALSPQLSEVARVPRPHRNIFRGPEE